MSELRGLNTRLESRKVYNRSKYIDSRNSQNREIIKPINQDELINFHSFTNNNINIDYKKYNVKSQFKTSTPINQLPTKQLPTSTPINQLPTNKQSSTQLSTSTPINQLPTNKQSLTQLPINQLPTNKQSSTQLPTYQTLINQLQNNKQLSPKNIPKLPTYQTSTPINQLPTNKQSSFTPINNKQLSPKNNLTYPSNNTINKKQTFLETNKSIEDYNSQKYIPEIGLKRKLINIILKSFQRRQYNINDNIVNKYLERYNIEYSNLNKIKLEQLIGDIRKEMNYKIHDKVEFEEETKEVSYLVSINSDDRDKKKWKNTNEFRIYFAPENDNNISTGYINRAFDNVISVQLISAIFPKNIENGNNLEDFPYVILEVDELGNSYETTNDNSSKAFAQLTFDINLGKYKKLVCRNNTEYKKYFNPRISLNKFTLRIKKPSGKLYNFGNISDNTENSEMNAVEYTPIIDTKTNEIIEQHTSSSDCNDTYSINLIFKITCLQRKLENMYLNRRDG